MSSTKINPTTDYQNRKSECKRRFTKLVPWHNLWKKGRKKKAVKFKRQTTNKTNKKNLNKLINIGLPKSQIECHNE
jgi:hypothetical protein